MKDKPGADFTRQPVEPLPPKKHNHHRMRQSSGRRKVFWAWLIIIAAGLLAFQQVFFAQETVTPLKSLTRLPVIRDIRDITGANDGFIKGESTDRINVLVLGQGGVGHDGPYLTDTIILASFKPSTGQVALLSIPRDMVARIPEYGFERINAANSIGETSDYPGGGAALAARVVEDALQQPVNYYVRIDFSGFEQVIDELGGVELMVDRAFTDEQYPNGNNGVMTVHFDKGEQKLTGERALQFARSRHAAGESGDFARARRQQKLILALKDEVLTPGNLLNPGKLIRIYKKLDAHIVTNAQIWELRAFLTLAKQADFETISFKVLDDSPAGPLYSTTVNGAYVLAPKISDYSEIAFIANNLFTINNIQKEQSSLAIRNGTPEPGLAINTAEILKAFEFQVVDIKNAPSQNYQQTVLFDLTGGTKPSSKKFLESTLQTKAQETLPVDANTGESDADFLIILGFDQVPTTHARALQENDNSS